MVLNCQFLLNFQGPNAVFNCKVSVILFRSKKIESSEAYGEKADLLDELYIFKERSFLLCCYLSEYSKQKCNGGQK